MAIDRFRLPIEFDVDPLVEDLARLGRDGWTPHFNTGYYSGDWSGLVLRSPGGRDGSLFTSGDEASIDTPIMASCPAIAEALMRLACPLKTVRLLRLASGASIREHRDYDLGLPGGEVRLHLPIQTNPGVSFHVSNRPVVMAPGELWYLDLSRPHRVHNGGGSDRIHLVIDAVVDDWLSDRIPFDAPDPDSARIAAALAGLSAEDSARNLERFQVLALNDDALHARLIATSDRDLFAEEAVRLGVEHDCPFTLDTVAAAVNRGRQRWRAACMP